MLHIIEVLRNLFAAIFGLCSTLQVGADNILYLSCHDGVLPILTASSDDAGFLREPDCQVLLVTMSNAGGAAVRTASIAHLPGPHPIPSELLVCWTVYASRNMHNSQTMLATQGLTLTVATSAYLMEPAMHPGLEAQAAARIYRLGAQQHPPITRSRPSRQEFRQNPSYSWT